MKVFSKKIKLPSILFVVKKNRLVLSPFKSQKLMYAENISCPSLY